MQTRFLAIAALLLTAVHAEAQSSAVVMDTASPQPHGWVVGASLGVPGYETTPSPDLFTVGFNFTHVSPGQLGADFAIGTIPRFLTGGAVPLGLRAGVALPLAAAPHLLVIPSAGASALGAVASGGAGGIVGLNAGLTTVMYMGSTGFRTGITIHAFDGADAPIWLFEIGLVSVPLGHGR
jgi:hypothetical protein